MATVNDLLERARSRVPEITPAQAHAEAQAAAPAGRPPLVLDVREPDERAQARIAGSAHVPRGLLEMRMDALEPDRSRRILVTCAGGNRSLLAAESLLDLGYADVASIAGGMRGWKEAGLPVDASAGMSDADQRRYARHLVIPEVGEEGQAKLLASKVALIGAGGLGSPAAFYLAAAGVGTLTIIDDDVVDETNLQRQILHDTRRLGRPKADSARETLLALNPGITVNAVRERLVAASAERLLAGHDVVLDGCDNFSTRYLVNDATLRLGIPNVHGSVFRFEGQATVFWSARGGPCYRCLYPQPPPPGLSPSCAEAGVLGVLPGVVGLLEAVETIKILLDRGSLLIGRLLVYDALEATFTELQLRRDPACAWCSGPTPPELTDLEVTCAAPPAS